MISDTHVPQYSRRLPEALALVAAARPGHIFHCGDFTSLEIVAAFERIAPFDGVAGNNDGPEVRSRFGRRKIVELGGRRIGLIHGDGQRGTTLQRARDAFAGETLDAIFFGHSHIPYCETLEGRLLLNPGSITDRRAQAQYSFALVELDAAPPAARLHYFGP